MGWTDKLAEMLRLNDGEQAYVGYPQMQVGLTKPRQAGYATGFLEGASGMDSMQPKNPITDPNYSAYEQGKNTGELAGIGAMAMSPIVLTRKDLLNKVFNQVEQKSALKPSALDNDLYEQGVKQAEFDNGNAYVRYLQDNKGNIRVLTLETENSPNVRGRQVLDWLKDTYKKPIKVNEVDTSAGGYWDKMQKEGRIEDWSHQMYQGKVNPLKD